MIKDEGGSPKVRKGSIRLPFWLALMRKEENQIVDGSK